MQLTRNILIVVSLGLLGLAWYFNGHKKIKSPYDDGYFNLLILGTDLVDTGHAVNTQSGASAKTSLQSKTVEHRQEAAPKEQPRGKEFIKDWNGRSDLILAIIYNVKTNHVAIISIPRDCKIYLKKGYQGITTARINSVNQLGGYQLAKRAVSGLLRIEFDRVVVFSISGFQELIDKVGKIEINVPKHLSYHDSKQNLHIEIAPGKHLMDGATLIKFLRYRDKDQGDIGRIKRQQIFFKAAVKKLTDPQLIAKAPSLIRSARDLFLTDMSAAEILKLGAQLRQVPKRNYSGYMVPGDFAKDGSWTVKHAELRAMMAKIVTPKNK